jgi:carboxyl-terminal processing protease
MIRLTVAKYFTPTGRLIQKPYHMDREDYDKELLTRFKNGELAHKDSIHLPDSLKFYTLKNTRLVYGGGGIMPDYFVSIDTSFYSEYYQQLMSKGMINQFVLEYVDRSRQNLLKQYPDFKSFQDDLEAGERLLPGLVQYAENKGIPENKADLLVSQEQIIRSLRAYIARDLWSTNESYQISNEKDPTFETAVTILKNWDKYETMLLHTK